MKMISAVRAFAIAAIAASLFVVAGCTTGAGVFNGLGKDTMSMVKFTKSDYDPRTGKNPITYASYLAMQDLAERLKIQIDWQTSSAGEACATNGGAYLAAGALGGASQALFYPGALAGPAAGFTGVTYGLGGCVNGVVTASYDGDYAVGDTLEKAMRDIENDGVEYLAADGTSLFHNYHATGAFTRSRNNRNSPAPELARHMPDFHGATVGVPAAK